MAESVATAVEVRSVGAAGSKARTVVVPSADLLVVGDGDVRAVDDRAGRRRWAASRRAWCRGPGPGCAAAEVSSPSLLPGTEKSSSGRPFWTTTRTTSPCSRTAEARPRTVVASTMLGDVGSARSTVVIVDSSPSSEVPMHDRAAVDEDQLAAGVAGPAVAAGVVDGGRGQLGRPVAGDVVGHEHALAQPQQQAARHLHHVGLVDADLLHVGAGLVAHRPRGLRDRAQRCPTPWALLASEPACASNITIGPLPPQP